MAEKHQKNERDGQTEEERGDWGRIREKSTETDLWRGSIDSAGFQLERSTGSWQLQGDSVLRVVNGIAVMDRWRESYGDMERDMLLLDLGKNAKILPDRQ